jgi:crotonobetainyl-CoA:carnitine CoA-transferase CaiB-like acyl-CoA transferase
MDGVRVVDFTHILAGPFCTQFLADAGANVIKIEPPTGEYARVRGPQRHGDGNFLSSYSAGVNRGKRSIALDLKNPKGLETARRLALSADVVVENFSPGALSRLGLEFKDLRAEKPSLITCSISLYGGLDTAGALATRGGLAIVAEGESSVTASNRDKDGNPIMIGLPLGDMATGMSAFGAISAALFGRSQTGEGRHLDISMVRTLWALNAITATTVQILNAPMSSFLTAGYGIYPASDGFVTLGVNNDSLWARAVTVLGKPEAADDPRFKHFAQRDSAEHYPAAEEVITSWTTTHTVQEFIDTVGPSGVPCGRIATVEDVLADPELRKLGFIDAIDDSVGGTIDVPSNPMGYHLENAGIPRLAAATDELLAEIGIDAAGVAELREAGAFGADQPASVTA